MSELDEAMLEWMAMSETLAYEAMERDIAPSERQALDDLTDRVIELDAPDFLEMAGLR